MTLVVAPDRSDARRSGSAVYVRMELKRMARNVRFSLLSVGFPLLLLALLAGPNRHKLLAGIPLPVYYMTGMVAWGAMAAVVAGGARIAADRAIGWNRQLRLTPLPVRTYFAAKVVTGYAMALCSIVLLFAAGAAFGARLPATGWLTVAGLVLVGLVPFAALGVLVGHVVSVDAMGPAMGGVTAVFALLGGSWGPIAEHGMLLRLTELLPSTWLVRAGRAGVSGGAWPAKGYVVIAVWSLALTWLAMRAYARDTRRA